MQCYESEALRLQLYTDTHLLTPDAVFDPLVLDQALDEFNIQRIREYETLDPSRRAELVARAAQLSSRKLSYVRPQAALAASFAASLS